MTKKTDAWMPLWIGDYLSATTRLTTEQHGAYLLLIMDYWKNGPPPDDDQVLAQITRMSVDAWSNASSILRAFFEHENGMLVHARIEKERAAAKNNSVKNTNRARAAAESRWAKNAPSNAPSIPQAMLDECPSPSPSHIPTTNVVGERGPKPRPARKCPEGFEVTPAMQDWATINAPLVNLDQATATFRDHTFKTAIADWAGAWRNWMRREQQYTTDRQRPGARPAVNRQEAIEQRNRAINNEWLHQQKTLDASQ
jgi:uncharacterized protein YdaU (DUF1376 family)